MADHNIAAARCYDSEFRTPRESVWRAHLGNTNAMSVIGRTEQYHIDRAGLTPDARSRVVDEVARCLQLVTRHEGIVLPVPRISFDLAGTSAGQYRRTRCRSGDYHQLRFNPYLLVRDFREGLTATVPHEVAHYAVAVLHGRRRLRPHGPEWRRVMGLLGAPPTVTHRQDLADLPVRRQRRWRYRCACRDHELSTTRHRRAQGGTRYLCSFCRTTLFPVEAAS